MTMLERSVNEREEARSPVDAQVASVLDKRDGWLTLERSVISKRQEQGTRAMDLEKITPTPTY